MASHESIHDPQPARFSDLEKCISNSLGLIKSGLASVDEINGIIERRVYVGKGTRSIYGRLVCGAVGCSATCNIELVDGKPVEKDLAEALRLIGECAAIKFYVDDGAITNIPDMDDQACAN